MQATAQDQGGDKAALKDKIRAAEIAYLSRELDLTPEEAQKFWPIYNNYNHEVDELIAERRRNRQQDRKDDATARKALDKEMDIEQRMVNVRTRYKQEFLKALPPSKASSVFKAEREFRGQLIRQLKERNTESRARRFKRN
jgi:Spy/CpxP family protein refolding chaperone